MIMQPGSSFMQSGLALLSGLDDTDIDWLLSTGTEQSVNAETTLVKQGHAVDSLYLVLQGLLTVTLDSAGGKQLASLGPGHIVGEMSFLENRPASATVRSREDSKLLVLPRTELDAKLRDDTAFAARFYRILAAVTSRRLRELESTLGLWLQDQPTPDEAALHRWENIAQATQEFKQLLIKTGNQLAAQNPASVEKLRSGLNDFARFIT